MVLTKQFQVLIQSSLAQGRDYEDIREILMKQGFQEADITQLFSDYRGGAGATAVQQAQVRSEFDDALSPTELGIYKAEAGGDVPVKPAPITAPLSTTANTNPNVHNFVPPKVKKDFVPVGFEEEESAQRRVQNDVTTFMNVGTNTQTAKDILSRQETSLVGNLPVAGRLPAPGTMPLPSEINTQTTTPKVFNDKGVSENDPIPVMENPIVAQKIDPSQKYINVGLSGMPEIEKVMMEEQAKKIEKSPWPLAIVLIFILAMIGGGFYWWFYIFNAPSTEETESEKLLQEIQIQKEADAQAQIPVEPTGPVDPFTGLPVEG
jgi:hypothetical protein